MESWKIYQRKSKLRRWLRQTGRLALPLLLGLLIFTIWRGINWLNTPVTNTTAFTSVSWSPEQQLNLFVSPRWLVSIEPLQSELEYARLAEQPEINELRALSQREKVYLDAYLSLKPQPQNLNQLSSSLRSATLKGTLESNLSRRQLFTLWWHLRADPRLKEKQNPQFPERQIIQEGFTASVLNGTTVPGLAAEATKWLENMGIKVVEVSNYKRQVDNSHLLVLREKKEYRTIQRIQQIFQPQLRYEPTQQPQRFDLQLIVGKDFVR